VAQLILAVLLVPTALALAIGRTLWRRPVFLVAVVMPWSSSHGERGRGEGTARLSLADVAAVGLGRFPT
jgi:hypothetical protein